MGAALLRSDGRQACVLVCVTGCIAAYKSCEIVRLLQKAGVRVKVLMSEHATHFVGPTTFRALTHETVAVGLFDDPQDPIHHISLAQEPDVVLVAPATANVMAKMAHGYRSCDEYRDVGGCCDAGEPLDPDCPRMRDRAAGMRQACMRRRWVGQAGNR